MMFNLMFIYLIINISLIFTSSPMIMMILLIIQLTNLIFMNSLINKSFWFSYIMFLIMISGLMILFMYLTSLIPNNIYKLNLNFKLITLIATTIILMILLIPQMNIYPNINYFMFNDTNFLTLMKIYNSKSIMFILFMMNYLFFALIIVTKIINLTNGPLRSL